MTYKYNITHSFDVTSDVCYKTLIPAARGSRQKFDNGYDVNFMCYKCNIT